MRELLFQKNNQNEDVLDYTIKKYFADLTTKYDIKSKIQSTIKYLKGTGEREMIKRAIKALNFLEKGNKKLID